MSQKNSMSSRLLILPILLTVLLLQGCAVSQSPITGNKRAYAYSWQEEIAIGRNADPQIVAQYGEYDDPELSAYVDSLGQALLAVSHLRRPGANAEWAATEFTFRVLDSPVVNAFALPGGFIYVTRGLMAHLENEAQLAVVIGHEIGHVAGRHGSKRAMNQMFGQAAVLAGAVGGQAIFGGNAAENVLNVAGSATQLLFMSYGRDDERESDDLGVEYASLAGYEADEGAEFFRSLKRMSEQSGQEIPSFMSTHPDPGEREQTIHRLASEWAAQVPTTRLGRDRYLGLVDNIVWGENPRQGFVQDGMFYHPEMAFQFPVPGGFQVINQPSQVVMIPENQAAYILMDVDAQHATAREAADAFRAQEGLTVVQAGLGQTGGLSGWVVLADATTQDGQTIRLRAHFIDFNRSVFRFVGITSRDGYDTYGDVFARTSNGFRSLTDSGILATQPTRVSLERAQGGTTFGTMVQNRTPQGVTPVEMAIMNQLELSSPLGAGQLVKMLR